MYSTSLPDWYYTRTKLKDYARCIIIITTHDIAFSSVKRGMRGYFQEILRVLCLPDGGFFSKQSLIPLARAILFFRFFRLICRNLIRSLLSCLNSGISCIQFQTSFLDFLINLTSSFKESLFDIFSSFC